MAMHLFFVAITITTFAILYMGLCSEAAGIDIKPNKCIATMQSSVHISCEPGTDDDGSNDVTLIELSRNGEDPIVFLRDCSNITYGIDESSQFQAEGQISKTPGQTYLNVTLRNPMSLDTGIYTCTVLYVDMHGKPKQTFASSNLAVEKLDVTSLEAVLGSFKERISTMEEIHRTLVTALNDQILTLEKKQEKRVTAMEEIHRTQVTALNDQILTLEKKQEKRMKAMEEIHGNHTSDSSDRDSTIMANMAAIMQNMTNFRKEIVQQIDNLADKVNYTVAFSATFKDNSDRPMTSGKTLVFPDIIAQVGEGYDVRTGIFTAPIHGIYIFHLVVTEKNKCDLDLSLMVNDKPLALLYTQDKDAWADQSSVSALAELKTGDKVYSVPDDSICKVAGNLRSVFTGYLIQAL